MSGRRKNDDKDGMSREEIKKLQKDIHDIVGHVCTTSGPCSCGKNVEGTDK